MLVVTVNLLGFLVASMAMPVSGTVQQKAATFRPFFPEITVLDTKKSPVVGASVLMMKAGGGKGSILSRGLTGQGGLFTIPMSAPLSRLFVSDGRSITTATVKSFHDLPMTLVLKRLGGSLRGTVVDAKGQAILKATVRCYEWYEGGGGYETRTCHTDEKGEFQFGGLFPDFEYGFEVSAPGFGLIQAIKHFKCKSGKTVVVPRVVLPVADSNIVGSLKDRSGKPIANARLSLVIYGREVFTNENGVFELSSLPKGKHMVEIRVGADYMSTTLSAGKSMNDVVFVQGN
jgi:hypothetical protein